MSGLTGVGEAPGTHLQPRGEALLQHMQVDLTGALRGLLDPQLKHAGDVTRGVQPQVHHRVSDTAHHQRTTHTLKPTHNRL